MINVKFTYFIILILIILIINVIKIKIIFFNYVIKIDKL